MEDAVDASEVERILDEVDALDREPRRVLLLERRVVVVREQVPADRVVAAVEERSEEMRADEAGRTGDDVAHGHGMLGEPMSGDHKCHVAEPEVREPCVDAVTQPDEAGACPEERETVGPDALDDKPALLEHRSELHFGELAMGKESWVRKSRLPRSRSTVHRGAFRILVKSRRLLSVVSTIRPPGASIRASSRMPRLGSSRCSIAWKQDDELELGVGERKALEVRAHELDLDPGLLGRERRRGQDALGDVDTDEPARSRAEPPDCPRDSGHRRSPASRSDATGRNPRSSSMTTANLRLTMGSGTTGTAYCNSPRRSSTSRRWSDGAAVVMRARQAYPDRLRRGRTAQTDNVAA